MTQTIKTGTRIELHGCPALGVSPETAIIGRWTKVNGTSKNHAGPNNPGWHVVRFSDGGGLLCHESGFRIVSNR